MSSEACPGGAFVVRSGRPEDAGAIAALLRACAGDCIPEPEPRLRDRAHHYRLVVDAAGRVAASAALVPAGPGAMLLRSVAVDEAHRGRRLARRLLDPLLERAREIGSAVWCRTTRPEFFRRLAFRETGREPDADGRTRHRMVFEPGRTGAGSPDRARQRTQSEPAAPTPADAAPPAHNGTRDDLPDRGDLARPGPAPRRPTPVERDPPPGAPLVTTPRAPAPETQAAPNTKAPTGAQTGREQ